MVLTRNARWGLLSALSNAPAAGVCACSFTDNASVLAGLGLTIALILASQLDTNVGSTEAGKKRVFEHIGQLLEVNLLKLGRA